MLSKEKLYRLIQEEMEGQSSSLNIKDLCYHYNERGEFFIYHGPKMLDLLSDFDYEHRRFIDNAFYQKGIIVAYMLVSPPKSNRCMKAREVKLSAVHPSYQRQRVGKILYAMAMMENYPDPLMSDRDSVSEKARWIWYGLDNKTPEVEKLPSKEGEYIGVFDDVEYPETEPKEDDCKLQGDEFLDKAYRYKGSGQNQKIKQLMSMNHKKYTSLATKEVEWMTSDKLENIVLPAAGDALFGYAYKG